MVEEGNRLESTATKNVLNLCSKLSWVPRNLSVCVYLLALRFVSVSCWGGGGGGRAEVELVGFRTHKSLNHKIGDNICRPIPLFSFFNHKFPLTPTPW
jgi:hypothetical protein